MRNYIFVFLGVFLFSTFEFISKLSGENISPIAIVVYRFFIGGLFLLPFVVLKDHIKKIDRIIFIKIIFIGLLNICISMMSLQLAIYWGKASLSAILISANPLFVSFFSKIINKEKLSSLKIIGIFVGFIGIILIVFGEHFNINHSKNIYLGIFFGILSSITFALYIVLSHKYIKIVGNFTFNSLSFLSGSIVLFIMGLLFKQDISFHISLNNILVILYFGIFVTGLAYLFFFEGLKKISPSKGSILFFLKPVLATILSIVFLKEEIHYLQIIGTIIVIVSIYTVLKK